MQEVARQREAQLTAAAKVLTWAGSAFLLVPLALVCCVLLVRAGLRREAIAVAVSLGGAMLISDVVKLLVSRPRPPLEHLQSVSGSSFPSGHATQASAFWFSLVLAAHTARASPTLVRSLGAVAVLLVATVAISRVYLGVHYVSDVVAGVLIGAGWAVYVARCVRDVTLVTATRGLALTAGPFQRLDRRLMRRSTRLRSPGLNRAMVALTRAANYSRLWLLVSGLLAACGGRRGRRAAGRGMLAIAIAAAVSNGPAKLLARRRRPAGRPAPALIRMPRSTSFPSGHSAAALAFATGACGELPALAADVGPPGHRGGLLPCSHGCALSERRGSGRRDRHRLRHALRAHGLAPRQTMTAPPPSRLERSMPGVRAIRTYQRAVAATGSRRRSRPGRDPRPSGHGLRAACRTARRSQASTRLSRAWSATRCSAPRGYSCSAPTRRSRR